MTEFACKHGRWGERRCDLLVKWAKDFMSTKHWTVTDKDFCTAVMFHLTDYDAHISGVYTDQWGLITATNYDESFTTRVQWDDFEPGLALTLRLFYLNAKRTKGHDNFGESNE